MRGRGERCHGGAPHAVCSFAAALGLAGRRRRLNDSAPRYRRHLERGGCGPRQVDSPDDADNVDVDGVLAPVDDDAWVGGALAKVDPQKLGL